MLLTIALAALPGSAWTQAPAPLSPDARRERLKEVRRIVHTLEAALVTDGALENLTLLAEPSLLYADDTRAVFGSSLWIWEQQGRAAGVAAIERNRGADQDAVWSFEFASLSPAALRLTLPAGKWAAGVATPRPVFDAPAVGSSRSRRQLQMKQLAERFTAVELHPKEGRIELRRLPAPIHRQSETAPGDGALFVFANGTNPEVVLSLRTLESANDAVWTYTLAALSSAEVIVNLDQREVWRDIKFDKPGDRSTYINGRLPTTAAAAASSQ